MAMHTEFRRWASLLQLATLPLLSMILQTSETSAATFISLSPRDTLKTKSLSFELMHYHHVSSPVAQPNLTLAQRIEISVKSSKQRAHFFKTRISTTLKTSGARFASEDGFSSPVYNYEGGYMMQLQLGTPARTFVVQADTGSDLVWVQCSKCKSCYQQPDPDFNPKASSTYKSLPCSNNLCSALQSNCSPTHTCRYTYSYGDLSSTVGDMATETVTLNTTKGTPTAFPDIVFGCDKHTQGNWTGMDGLAGLGRGRLSLVSQLGSQFGNIFSYCLVDYFSATTKTSPLLFGDTGGANLSFTPLISNPAPDSFFHTFYYVNLLGITVNRHRVSYPRDAFSFDHFGNGGFLLDSGTTLSQLPRSVQSAFVSRISSLIHYPTVNGSSQGFDLCYDLQNVSSPVWPSVVFNFENVDLALPGNNVFLLVDNAGTYCLAFQAGDPSGTYIFGNVQQQNFQIAYDLANAKVGFASVTC